MVPIGGRPAAAQGGSRRLGGHRHGWRPSPRRRPAAAMPRVWRRDRPVDERDVGEHVDELRKRDAALDVVDLIVDAAWAVAAATRCDALLDAEVHQLLCLLVRCACALARRRESERAQRVAHVVADDEAVIVGVEELEDEEAAELVEVDGAGAIDVDLVDHVVELLCRRTARRKQSGG
eukprot:362608-Chlamydomonas_euryale.AAC.6